MQYPTTPQSVLDWNAKVRAQACPRCYSTHAGEC